MRRSLLVLAVIVATFLTGTIVAYARFTDIAPTDGNTLVLDVLDAPTSVTATGGATITLDWTATPDTYATGHRILRSTASGGPYSQVGQVSPRTVTTFVDSPSAGTYFYVVRAYHQSWESTNSNEVTATCC